MPGLRNVRRGGSQALDHWVLLSTLVNYYLLAFYSEARSTPDVAFRSQKDFRQQIIEALLFMGKTSDVSRKRRVSHMDPDSSQEPFHAHKLVKMTSQKQCVACKGLRHQDRPQKRVALGEIAGNQKRESERKDTLFKCNKCDVALCKIRPCFSIYHKK